MAYSCVFHWSDGIPERSDLLVEVAARVLKKKDARFVMIGDGKMRNQCENQTHKLGIGNSCNFLGYASDNTLIDWFNACDLVYVPSRNKPFGKQ
jgi:glycosyltransferase involved in cell wall biosynthesis